MAGMAVDRPKGLVDKLVVKTLGGISPESEAMTRKIIDLQARAGGRTVGGRHTLLASTP